MESNFGFKRTLSVRSRSSQSGAVLIAVLWIIILLTIFAAVVASRSLRDRTLATRWWETEQTRIQEDSALRLELLHLTEDVSAPRPVTSQEDFSVFGQPIVVALEREDGRIDLNFAPPALLTEAFTAIGVEGPGAQNLASQVVQWRQAEPLIDAAAAAPPNSRHGPFESVSEIRQLPLAQSLSDRQLDAFTVYSRLSEPIWTGAPEVLATLSMKKLHAEPSSRLQAASWTRASLVGQVVRICACIKGPRGHQCRRIIVRMTGRQESPWQIYVWEDASAGALR